VTLALQHTSLVASIAALQQSMERDILQDYNWKEGLAIKEQLTDWHPGVIHF